MRIVDKFGVEDTVFYEVDITTFYNCTRNLLQTTEFAHMNGHWEDYNLFVYLVSWDSPGWEYHWGSVIYSNISDFVIQGAAVV